MSTRSSYSVLLVGAEELYIGPVREVVAKAIKILISLSFDLKVEKRFILTQDKSTHQVCVEEYGSIGENDEILTYFYETNNLYEKENLLLKAGFEVVVYK